ncbi:hypothetical protein RRG08_004286 [Elysia crispata]|uniref:adenosine deaminase n=1 Tax=Elysia crispata TaxID=231223 RepID=A0AAE0YDJ9_9GAST|nr:hypothetical protein RRG08_004286 [Elysia crispata]
MHISKEKRPLAIVIIVALLLLVGLASVFLILNFSYAHTDALHAVEIAVTNKSRGRGYNAEEYMMARQRLLSKEQRRALGAWLQLSEKESVLNEILLHEKKEIMEKSRLDRLTYTPALSFFKSKEWMENTTTFKIIRKMPKGAALHLHTTAMTSLDWLVKNITYREHVYTCVDKDGFALLSAFLHPPNDTECQWKPVSEERAEAPSSDKFDEELRKNLSFLIPDPLTAYSGTNQAWDRFNKYFKQVGSLLINAPIMQDYFRQALQEFWEDNVQYIEWRGGVRGYKEINGTVHDAVYGAEMFKKVVEEFVAQHPDFMGAKMIISGVRYRSEQTIEDHVKLATLMHRQYPNFILGYDLVGQEDPLNPLLFYLDALLYPTRQSLDDALPYFFHAGETKWEGTDVDENLLDALLLNTTRIGHGYALAKHPELADLVRSRGIAVEVNPISNQLLGLVSDLRNHAIVPLLADDFPLVISSDDPAAWEALPLTHDFFVAFMDLSGQDMGLGFLKQLAINSLKYSALDNYDKEAALGLWESKWNKFVKEAVAEFS